MVVLVTSVHYGDAMAESHSPGLSDVIALLGGANPLATIGKTIEPFRRGVNDFLATLENLNATMATLNDVATRVSRLLDDVEEPIRAFMPQVTRSIKAADAVINQISAPIDKVAPGLTRLADTLAAPVFVNMATDIASFIEGMGDLARRLQPLAQMAESAGSMFGLRPLGALLGGSGRPPQPAARVASPPPLLPAPVPRAASSRKAAANQSASNNFAANNVAPRKQAAAKQAAAKQAAAKQAAAKQGAARKAAPE